ncbi:hypothetical protein [Paraliomyxa miuraensis]|uniref:hypothetical protein n=1 Tax=Paraliomyxa miuraensis TaxID=376150 RepID=UPI0022512889|nr:hypothetical protein [Paraliomyxa miuraensis]MCX4246240.1 hypothetical protein [Paraliomyxa miuraensis]
MLRSNEDLPPSPSPSSSGPPRIVLLAPEALRPQVACVEDGLRARGYRVQVALGHKARRWVRQAPPGPPSLRVMCVAEIDPAYAEQLRKGRDDFHIVALRTPRSVVQEVERITGRVRVRRQPRPSRMYLAQPTLIEQQLRAGRSWGWTAVAGVVLLTLGAGVGAVMTGPARSTTAPSDSAVLGRAPARPTASEDAMTPKREEPVLSAVALDRD